MDWCTSTCSCDSFWIVLCRHSWLYQAILSDTSHLLSKVVMPNSWRSKCREFITDAPLVNPLDAVGDTCWRKPDSVCHKDVRGRHEHLLFHRFDYSILCPYTIDSEVNRFGGGIYAVFLTIIGISMFDYFMRIEKMDLSLVESAGLFPVWMIFYVMGVLKAQGIEYPFQCKHPLRYAILAILLCCVHIYMIYQVCGTITPGIKLSAHIYSYFLIMWLFTDKARMYYNKMGNTTLGRLVVYIGRVSFFMYLTHCLILFTYLHLHMPNLWSLRWILSIVLSTLMAYMCDKICPARMRRHVGFDWK